MMATRPGHPGEFWPLQRRASGTWFLFSGVEVGVDAEPGVAVARGKTALS